jgi:hypothetical protein
MRSAAGRQIGVIGTTVRIVLGVVLLSFGALGGRFVLVAWRPQLHLETASLAIGLVVLPLALTAWQWRRIRRDPSPISATGAGATTLNIVVFALLVSTARVPPISFLGFAALIFYGASMLLAAARGYAGCEVLAASNWLLRRDDQIGCLVLSPIDQMERR